MFERSGARFPLNTILIGFFVLTIQSSLAHSAELTLDLSYYYYEEKLVELGLWMIPRTPLSFL